MGKRWKNANGKTPTIELKFRNDFDTCSRNKDLAGAISLFKSAISQNIKLSLFHFNRFLYICSISIESARETAIEQGFAIFNHMIASNINPNEATITSVSRLAAAKDDADLAFELVKSLVKYNEKPRLRTYDPALHCYVKKLDAEKAYLVEKDVLSMGLCLEEPEIAALLKVSAEVGNAEKVYEYLQKLRRSVSCVSESTAEIIEGWFCGKKAKKAGSGLEELDKGRVKDEVLKNGGGWHGLGWIGKGKWVVSRTNVDSSGRCHACRDLLACVDIGKEDTEKFAQSVMALAIEREARSNFTQFQNWLDRHTDFEAVVDGANIGLYQQNFAAGEFSVSQLDTVVKKLYDRSKKWPLVILHNKRVRALQADPSNRELIEEWIRKGILYRAPAGSNDDWYWLYASVKHNSMIVTNDEMRDHIFELLGSSFFPRWKERHQVRYSFPKGKLKLQMPPSYSLVIQESEKGIWHVPLAGEHDDESSRKWLCITRPRPFKISKEATNIPKASETGELTTTNGTTLNHNSNASHTPDTKAKLGKRKKRHDESPTR